MPNGDIFTNKNIAVFLSFATLLGMVVFAWDQVVTVDEFKEVAEKVERIDKELVEQRTDIKWIRQEMENKP